MSFSFNRIGLLMFYLDPEPPLRHRKLEMPNEIRTVLGTGRGRFLTRTYDECLACCAGVIEIIPKPRIVHVM